MRRRSVSVYAKTEDEFKQKLNEVDKKQKEQYKEDEDNLFGNDGLKIYYSNKENYNFENRPCTRLESKLQGLGTKVGADNVQSEEAEEKELFDKIEDINNCYKVKEKKPQYKAEKTLQTLCSYFKDNINHMVKSIESRGSESQRSNHRDRQNNDDLVIYSSIRRPSRSMSNNVIHDFDIKQVIDIIVKQSCKLGEESACHSCDTANMGSLTSGSSISTNLSRDIFTKNIAVEEEVIKIMLIGTTQVGKSLLINNFLECRRNKYIPSNGLEIKKKVVKIFDKNVRIEFYDTDSNFHKKETSKIYYKLTDTFFYVVDFLKKESCDFVRLLHEKVYDNSPTNSYVLVGFNYSPQDSKTQSEIVSFCEEYSITFFPLQRAETFVISNENIINLFSLMLLKKLSRKRKRKSKVLNSSLKESNDNNSYASCVDPDKIPMEFSNEYKMNHYTAFDESSNDEMLVRPAHRKWSVGGLNL